MLTILLATAAGLTYVVNNGGVKETSKQTTSTETPAAGHSEDVSTSSK